MTIYIVSSDYSDLDVNILKVFTDLDKANDYAKRSIFDTWRVQDGCIFDSIERNDGTFAYRLNHENGEYVYFVEKYEVEE
jgi:hypothetical protein